MRIGALDAELRPRFHLLARPSGPVLDRGGEAAVQRPVRPDTGDDMALVEMGVHVDQGRPHHPPFEIDARDAAPSAPRRTQFDDPPIVDDEVDENAIFPIRGALADRQVDEGKRNARSRRR